MTPEQAKVLIEVANDVKWLVKEQTRTNGTMTAHVKDSDKFRHQVTRNTTWRIAHHFFFTGIVVAIGFLIKHIIYGK